MHTTSTSHLKKLTFAYGAGSLKLKLGLTFCKTRGLANKN